MNDQIEAGINVFLAWVLTPTGAVLTLLLMALASFTGLGKWLRWPTRIFSIMLKFVVCLYFVWIVGDILDAWGIPVREILAQVAAVVVGWIPSLVASFLDFLSRLFQVAG